MEESSFNMFAQAHFTDENNIGIKENVEKSRRFV